MYCETFILIVVVKLFVDDDRSEDNDVVEQLSVFLDERYQRSLVIQVMENWTFPPHHESMEGKM